MQNPKYFLDIYNCDEYFALRSIDERNIVYEGMFKDLNIGENDEQWVDKLDDFFEKKLGIMPDEWEIG